MDEELITKLIECRDSGKERIHIDGRLGYYYLIPRPPLREGHAGRENYETVTLILIKGSQTFYIPKGALDKCTTDQNRT